MSTASVAEVARGGEAEVAAAVRAARDAFGGWSATPPQDRAAVLGVVAGPLAVPAEFGAQPSASEEVSSTAFGRGLGIPRHPAPGQNLRRQPVPSSHAPPLRPR